MYACGASACLEKLTAASVLHIPQCLVQLVALCSLGTPSSSCTREEHSLEPCRVMPYPGFGLAVMGLASPLSSGELPWSLVSCSTGRLLLSAHLASGTTRVGQGWCNGARTQGIVLLCLPRGRQTCSRETSPGEHRSRKRGCNTMQTAWLYRLALTIMYFAF